MFYPSPLTDIIHLLGTIPVDVNAVARRMGITLTADVGDASGRYNLALRIASLRLTGNPDIDTEKSVFVRNLIGRQARSIVLPTHLLPTKALERTDIAGIAEIFAVPSHVVESRLSDRSLLTI